MRIWGFLLAAVCLGCAHPGTRVEHDTGFDFSRYRRVGVAPFIDGRGQGRSITEGIAGGLKRIGHGGADLKAVADIIREYKPDRDFGMTIEALELLRGKASADAIIMGRMNPDWSAASISLVDTETGDSVLTAALKPADRKQKAFTSADEVVTETLRVLTVLAQ
ncbi:MAG: hypothetical protein NTY77_07940 [Elusimicrobia bacterium]|nr:hypothetical protein [Elusimicrobiota bacterium]